MDTSKQSLEAPTEPTGETFPYFLDLYINPMLAASEQAPYHSFPCKHEKFIHSAAPPFRNKSYDFFRYSFQNTKKPFTQVSNTNKQSLSAPLA